MEGNLRHEEENQNRQQIDASYFDAGKSYGRKCPHSSYKFQEE